MQREALKRAAAALALEAVEPGMRLGLGTGSTAKHFVELLAGRVADGLDVRCIATSEQTAALATRLGLRIETFDDLDELDLTIDGADEISPDLSLIKGGGAALLREKIVASASRRMIVIADDAKLVPALGRFPLPIEIVPFGRAATIRAVGEVLAGCGLPVRLALRLSATGDPVLTDGGHQLIDASCGRIDAPAALARGLSEVPGVVEHGLFLGLASAAFVASGEGVLRLGSPGSESRAASD